MAGDTAEEERIDEQDQDQDQDHTAAVSLLDALPDPWRTTPSQRERLAPAVCAALAAGWTPETLRRELSRNPNGMHNPFATLRSRLNALPAAPVRRSRGRKWCGECDRSTRMLTDAHGDHPRPCPHCKAPVERRRPAAAGGPEPVADGVRATAAGLKAQYRAATARNGNRSKESDRDNGNSNGTRNDNGNGNGSAERDTAPVDSSTR